MFLGVTKFVKEFSMSVVSRGNDRMYNLREIVGSKIFIKIVEKNSDVLYTIIVFVTCRMPIIITLKQPLRFVCENSIIKKRSKLKIVYRHHLYHDHHYNIRFRSSVPEFLILTIAYFLNNPSDMACDIRAKPDQCWSKVC